MNLPSYNQDVVIDIKVFDRKLQASHRTQAILEQRHDAELCVPQRSKQQIWFGIYLIACSLITEDFDIG